MRQVWADKHEGQMPQLSVEGSQAFTGLILNQVQSGHWGLFSHSKAVSRADEHMHRGSKPVTSREGHHMQSEYEKELMAAVNIVELQERVEVIIVTTIMVLHSNPHLTNLWVHEYELRAPFKYLFGKRALGRYPWASAAMASALLDAMLQRIAASILDDHMTLREALVETRKDSNFWFLHLFGPMNKESDSVRRIDRPPDNNELPPLKRRRNQQWIDNASSSSWTPGKGYSNAWNGSGGKGSGKGKKGKSRRGGDGPRFTTTSTGMPLPSQQTPPPDWGGDAKKSRRNRDTQMDKAFALIIIPPPAVGTATGTTTIVLACSGMAYIASSNTLTNAIGAKIAPTRKHALRLRLRAKGYQPQRRNGGALRIGQY